MLAPLSAWIAIRGTIEWTPVLLGLAVLTWVAGFDILYACQDVDFDRRAKLHSIPANLGVARALLLAMLLHGVTILMLLALWPIVKLGLIYLVGVIAVAGLLAYEHWLVRPSDLTRMNLAFFHVNTVVSLGIFLVVLADRIWPLP
jgi:4-hydroxybenzoate polyprenyltransferase